MNFSLLFSSGDETENRRPQIQNQVPLLPEVRRHGLSFHASQGESRRSRVEMSPRTPLQNFFLFTGFSRLETNALRAPLVFRCKIVDCLFLYRVYVCIFFCFNLRTNGGY